MTSFENDVAQPVAWLESIDYFWQITKDAGAQRVRSCTLGRILTVWGSLTLTELFYSQVSFLHHLIFPQLVRCILDDDLAGLQHVPPASYGECHERILLY